MAPLYSVISRCSPLVLRLSSSVRSCKTSPLLSANTTCILLLPKVTMVNEKWLVCAEFSYEGSPHLMVPLISSSSRPKMFLPGQVGVTSQYLEIGIPQPHFLSPVPSYKRLVPVSRRNCLQMLTVSNFARRISVIRSSHMFSHSCDALR